MTKRELIRSQNELESVANLMAKELKNFKDNSVSRYTRVTYEGATFINGQGSRWNTTDSNFNKEDLNRGIYTQTGVDDLLTHNFKEVVVARDLQDHRFNFSPKGVPLPTKESVHFEDIPEDIGFYDDEMREFTREHRNSRLTRVLRVEQRVITNSKGGKVIQSIPFFSIGYSQGYNPIPTSRCLSVVCNSDEDIRRLPEMIKYIADPTPDKRIKKSKTFSQAFEGLHGIAPLKFGSLEEAGIPLSELYDVVMLTGVPVHEIFGHHFEEPIRFLDFGESGTFKHGQGIQNKGLILKDNPTQEIEGFRVEGFTYFDAYGRRRKERTHLQDGKVVGFLGSEYADPKKLKQFLNLERSEFVGNASQYMDGHFPQPRMSCTVIDGPTENFDLEGKILLVSHEGHTQPQDKTYMVKSYEAYVVKDGEPQRVIPLQVTGGINQALANMVLLDDKSYQTGMCGKPEPIYYPQSRGVAEVQVSQLAKSQLWLRQQVYPLPISDVHLKVLKRKS